MHDNNSLEASLTRHDDVKVPAIQEGKRESFSDFADEIWIISEDDFKKLDLVDKEYGGFIFPVFRPGGIPVVP